MIGVWLHLAAQAHDQAIDGAVTRAIGSVEDTFGQHFPTERLPPTFDQGVQQPELGRGQVAASAIRAVEFAFGDLKRPFPAGLARRRTARIRARISRGIAVLWI